MGYHYLAMPWEKLSGVEKQVYLDMSLSAAATLMKEGFSIYHPIAQGQLVAKRMKAMGMDPFPHETWLALDTPFLSACAGLFVLAEGDHWRDSTGVQFEINYLHRIGRPVRYLYQEPDGTFAATLSPRGGV